MAQLALLGGPAVRERPFPAWPQAGAEERQWLEEVLGSGRWFAGPLGDDPDSLGTLFGERFARLHGARYGLPVANGSVAIEIALRALDVGLGDEVIVPAYTFVSTATSVLMVGGVPVFADVEAETYCLDPKDLDGRISPKTRAILPVHLGGHMADMPAIGRVAEAEGLALIEDAAQAIGARWEGKMAGSWGELGTFSFQSNKTVTAGEGGLVMTSDPELAQKVTALRAFGRVGGRASERSSALSSERLSSNYRLSELQSAVLLSQLERFPAQDALRQANAARLTKGVSQIPGLAPVGKRGSDMKHGYYYYLIRYEPEQFGHLNPARLCEALNAEGIPFVPGDPHPVYRHPVFKPENLVKNLCPEVLEQFRRAVDLRDPQCPVAEEACGRTLLLRHQVLLAEPEDMDDILEALWKVHRGADKLR